MRDSRPSLAGMLRSWIGLGAPAGDEGGELPTPTPLSPVGPLEPATPVGLPAGAAPRHVHPPPFPTTGAVLGSRYRLGEELGRGAGAVVFVAVDTELDQEVAVKVLRPGGLYELDGARTLGASLRAEARAAMRLSHPNIVRVFTYERDQGWEYLVMERVRGRDLARVRKDAPGRRLPLDEVVRIGVACLDALAYAHRVGFVHHDLKPANILVAADGTVKLCDLGLARPPGGAGQGDVLAGSPLYMSPERIRGGMGGPPSDLYSLAATLYTLLTGSPPFGGRSEVALKGHLVQPLPLAEEVPPALYRVLARAMEKDVASRYETAEEMRVDLAHAVEADRAAGVPVGAPVAGGIAATAGGGAAGSGAAAGSGGPAGTGGTSRAERAWRRAEGLRQAAARGALVRVTVGGGGAILDAGTIGVPAGAASGAASGAATGVPAEAASGAAHAELAVGASDPTDIGAARRAVVVVPPLGSPANPPGAPPASAGRPGGEALVAPGGDADQSAQPSPAFERATAGASGEGDEAAGARGEEPGSRGRDMGAGSGPVVGAPLDAAPPAPTSVGEEEASGAPVGVAPVAEPRALPVAEPRALPVAEPRALPVAEVPAPPVVAGPPVAPPGMAWIAARTVEVLRRSIELPGFFLDRHPVTNVEWRAFVIATGEVPPAHWFGLAPPAGRDEHPAVGMTVAQARRYAAWRGRRLPSAAEWLAVATGRHPFPWGDTCRHEHCQCTRAGATATAAVGAHPGSASAEGVQDLLGNVWEWVEADPRLPPPDPGTAWALGGSYLHPCRDGRVPMTGVGESSSFLYLGFRCAADAPEGG